MIVNPNAQQADILLTLSSHLTKVTSMSRGHLLARENPLLPRTDPASHSSHWLHDGGTRTLTCYLVQMDSE